MDWTARDEALLEAAKLASHLRKGWNPPPLQTLQTPVSFQSAERAYYQAPCRIRKYLDNYQPREKEPVYLGESAEFFRSLGHGVDYLKIHRAKKYGFKARAGIVYLTNHRFALDDPGEEDWFSIFFTNIRRRECQGDGIMLHVGGATRFKLFLDFPEWTDVLFRYLAHGDRGGARFDPGFLERARAAGREVPEGFG